MTIKLEFNPFNPEFQENPYPLYHRLRNEAPVYKVRNFTGHEWVLTRYVDVKNILVDNRFIVDDIPGRVREKSGFIRQDLSVLNQIISNWLFFLEPPAHTNMRGLVSKNFSIGMIEKMRGHIQETVDYLISKMGNKRRIDVMADFASQLPAMVSTQMLGIPSSDIERLTSWAEVFFRVFQQPIPLQVYDSINQVAGEFKGYFRGKIAQLNQRSPEGLIKELWQANLEEEHLVALSTMLFTVGQATTENLIGNGILALLEHPEELTKLRENPGMIKSGVEELLRYDAPVQLIDRLAATDVEIDGNVIRQGERVHLLLGAANRDPQQFSDPDKLLLTRKDSQAIAFGYGIHHCLGAALARMEVQIAINTFIQRFDNFQVCKEEVERRKNYAVRGVKVLPLILS